MENGSKKRTVGFRDEMCLKLTPEILNQIQGPHRSHFREGQENGLKEPNAVNHERRMFM